MKNILRILFVMSAIAFIATVTACTVAEKTAKLALSFGKPKINSTGVTFDASKEVVKITINPSLLTFDNTSSIVFTVKFANNRKGFIIPTNVEKAADLKTTHTATLLGLDDIDANLNETYSYLRDTTPGFVVMFYTPNWSGLAGLKEGTTPTVSCFSMPKGISDKSFVTNVKAADDHALVNDGLPQVFCSFTYSVTSPAAGKAWATEVAKLSADKNVQKVNFVGIATGEDKASAIAKVAPSLLTDDGLSTADSARLVEKYDTVIQKVEIVIAPAK